ncbi:DUF7282 domain-containing protein [Halorientalis marina]|uniref:DUF7282 domain-containing protein n=1 Tax=Halorientalis marina TaxID=2931976 RepID=UPI001FF460BF|nr:hypothetical protein [Halorientalis marina]
MPGRRPLLVVVPLLCATLVAPAATAQPPASDARDTQTECELPDAPTDTDRSELLVAPAGTQDELTSPTAIRRAVRTGRLTAPRRSGTIRVDDAPRASVALGDTVVYQIVSNESGALLDRLAAANGSTPTTRFASLVSADGVGFEYVGPGGNPPALNLSASIAAERFGVVPDRESGVLYMVVESGALLFEQDRESSQTEGLGRRGLRLSITSENGSADGPALLTTEYEVVPREVRFFGGEDDQFERATAPAQSVCGATTVAPGSEITVGYRSLDGGPLRTVGTATVRDSYSFTGTLNLSGTAPGAYILGGRNLSTADPRTLLVVGNVSVAALDVADVRELARVERITYELTSTDGGFVVFRNETGAVVGTSILWTPGRVSSGLLLDRPVRRNGTLTATVYRDVNGNETYDAADEPYRVGGRPVTATANLTVIDPDPAPDRSTTQTTARSTPTVAPGTTVSVTTGAGFSSLAALGAVLAVVAFALRD